MFFIRYLEHFVANDPFCIIDKGSTTTGAINLLSFSEEEPTFQVVPGVAICTIGKTSTNLDNN
jgi:hypothetical protein